MYNSKNIEVLKDVLAPSEDKHANLQSLFIWRNEEKFVGGNRVVIADPQEAIWGNRPLSSGVLCRKEDDGLYSYNLPYIYGDKENLLFKTGYNVLINKNSVVCIIHVQTDDTWTGEQKLLLQDMLSTCILKALVDLGVNRDDIHGSKNDFYFKGAKFSGSEQRFCGDVFTGGILTTLKMSPEKDIFARLTGKYAHAKPITGIAEEVPSVTKEAFIDKLYEKVTAYVEEHFN